MPNHWPTAILFADDDTDVRRLSAEILRRAGFLVWEAPTGSEALRLVRQHPDLVLLDVCLPDVSGFEVCRRIRADPDTALIPVLLLSGVANSSEDRTQGLENGGDGYLVKPVEPAELIAHVRALLRLHWAEESLRESEERYRLIAENASAAVFMLDEQSTILFANRAAEEVFGYTVDELLNQKVTLLMTEPLRGRHEAALARYLSTGQRSGRWERREVPGRHRSGRKIALEVSFGEFRDRQKRRRFVGIVQDVTARKEAEQALTTLSRRLLEVQEEERRHIARELHDVIGQELTALKVALHAVQQRASGTSAVPHLEEAVGQVGQVMHQVRTLSLGLRPPMMDDLGLVPALRWHVKGVRERTGLAVQLDVGAVPERLSAHLEMTCFRVVQEAINNTVKHAQARRASVKLLYQGTEMEVVIRDDGVGFDVAVARRRCVQGASFGLLGMEERVLLLGGLFRITSVPRQGTEIRARFPLGSTSSAWEQQGNDHEAHPGPAG
jgi:two-component system sensor histidine kinase UhpB